MAHLQKNLWSQHGTNEFWIRMTREPCTHSARKPNYSQPALSSNPPLTGTGAKPSVLGKHQTGAGMSSMPQTTRNVVDFMDVLILSNELFNFCVLVLFAHYGLGWDYLHIQISCNIINSQSLDRCNLERSCTNVEKRCANVSIAINYSFVHMFWEITLWVTLQRSWTFVLNVTSHSILLIIWRYITCSKCSKAAPLWTVP